MADRLFKLGQVVMTPGAVGALQSQGITGAEYLQRHATGDWGEMDKEDSWMNDEAVKNGNRIMSSYSMPNGEKLWIITEGTYNAE